MENYQKEYLNKLGSRIEALVAAEASLTSGNQEAGASARRIAHTLRGSGGTFGFPEITRLAEAVEESAPGDLLGRLTKLIQYLRSLKLDTGTAADSILIIDDSEEMLLILGAILRHQNYRVLQAESAAQAREVLTRQQVTLILLDLVLPDTDGRNFLIELKEDLVTTAIPVIVLSAKSSPQIKAECYALGAENYFEKPIDPALLTTKVAATLQTSKNIQKDLREDLLTGLLNRAAFRGQYNREMKEAAKRRIESSLAVLDLDHFKAVNDQYGHLVGDALLKYVADIIKQYLRPADIFGRWGGEEFLILFPDTSVQTANDVLTEALDDLLQHPVPIPGKEDESTLVSFSAGVVAIDKQTPFDECFALADKYLYTAKNSGRRQIVTESSQDKTTPRAILLAEDDNLTAEFIIHRLQRSDFKITHYLAGDQAYAAACREPYDLVITDVKMPGMDGFELVQRLRQKGINQHTPVIILSSMGRESDISRGLELGANDYILKPFSPTELLARVHRLLK